MSESKFTWVETHKGLVEYLLAKENNQQELIELLKSVGIGPFNDKSAPMEGHDIELTEIDPFTFFCYINKYGRDRKINYLNQIAQKLNLKFTEDELGLPSSQAQKVWLFPYKFNRTNNEIPRLWHFFKACVNQQITDDDFIDVLGIKSVGKIKITEVLFYVNPERYLPINGPTIPYIRQVLGIDTSFNSYTEYLALLDKIREKNNRPFYEISYEAWKWNQSNKDVKTTGIHYWLYSPGEQANKWDEFYKEKVMALGWDELQDLNLYKDKNEISKVLKELYKANTEKHNDATANYDFLSNMNVGDIIIVKKGVHQLLGYGKVTSEYYYDSERNEYKHRREVDWELKGEWNVPESMVVKTLTDITSYPASENPNVRYYEYLMNIMQNKNITAMETETEIIKALTYKKQIILQGPPGTGKTREAKIIAEKLIGYIEKKIDKPLTITSMDIESLLYVGLQIDSVQQRSKYKITYIAHNRVRIKLSSGSEYTLNIHIIIDWYNSKKWDKNQQENGLDPYYAAIAKYIYENIDATNEKYKNSHQIKLIQFHPSYTYEDFVRGIEANPIGTTVEYKSVNKILGDFSQVALNNYLDSKKEPETISKEEITNELFDEFVDDLTEKVETNPIELTPNVTIISVDESAFRYKGKDGWSDLGNRMSFKDIKQAYYDGNTTRQDLKKNQNLSGLARQHASYFIRILNMFQQYVKENSVKFKNEDTSKKVLLKNYVLIIDEINRANLSSVLGELIYALEYRGESVESMYAVDGKNELILPPNLYIIGTMNTADRSVGHIDYAIRRRFAFVDVLPKELNNDDKIYFNSEGFSEVSKLFIKLGQNDEIDFEKGEKSNYLSGDFNAKDVAIGHSYFIVEKDKTTESEKANIFAMKMKYEVIPILKEYLKDGVFTEEAESEINAIERKYQ